MKKYVIKGVFEDNTTVSIETNSTIKVMLFKSKLKKMEFDKFKLKKLYVDKKEESYEI